MKLKLPLKLRSAVIDIEVDLKCCSSTCLLKKRKIVQAIPAGLGNGVDGESSILDALFVTADQTILKIVHLQSGEMVSEQLKELRDVNGLTSVIASCDCTVETNKVEGYIVEIVDSIHYRSLSSKYELFKLTTEKDVICFLRGALAVLLEINDRGFVHADPAYWNFLFDGARVNLIDIQEIRPIDDVSISLQITRFIDLFIAPILSHHVSRTINSELISMVVESKIFPFNESELTAIVNISKRANQSSIEHFKVSQKFAHLDMTCREAKRTYEGYVISLRKEIERLTLIDSSRLYLTAADKPLVANTLLNQHGEQDTLSQKLSFELAESIAAQNEKEEVIKSLSRALLAYRSANAVFTPLRLMLSPFKVVARHARAMLSPRLGNLNQYPPRQLSLVPNRPRTAQQSAAPKISIVTPSFKQGAFIEKTILSVLDQQYPNLEYFVQDGGSLDETVDILQKHAARLSGWVTERDSGQSQAINRGFAKTSGDIMAWLNSDDLLLPGALGTVANYFNRHPEVDVLYGNRLLIDEDDMEIGRWILPGHDSAVLSWVDYVPQETLFWRRRIWDKVGGRVDESFRFAMDWDLLVRFREAGAKFGHIPKFLGVFRIHAHQKTSANINQIGHQEMNRIRERIFGRIPSQKEIRKAILPYLMRHIALDLLYRVQKRLVLEA